MAATYHQGGLHALSNPSPHIYSPFKLHLQGNRKSAVELLQETKSLYVKSNAVLGANQAFRSKEQNHQLYKKNEEIEGVRGKLVAVRRSNVSACSDQLQAKLRRLLNVDSKENLQDVDASSDSVKRERVISQGCKSLPDLTVAKELSPTRGKPGRRKSSGDGVSARLSSSSTIKGTTYSNIECDELSEDESTEEESASSATSYGKPPSLGSVSLGGSASKLEIRKEGLDKCVEWEGETVGVIPRSKSDLSWRQGPCRDATPSDDKSKPLQILEPPMELPSSLEDFFTYLGLPQPKYFEDIEKSDMSSAYLSGSSSVESGSPRRRVNRPHDASSNNSGSSDSGNKMRSQTLSIVETNARVIKWLCHCQKINT